MSQPSPSGLVSFLFTDIEGSTQLWENDPEAAAASVTRHDAIVREAVAGNGGKVFSTAGDSFGIAFSQPGQAVEAALVIQRRLQSEPWPGPPVRVRMGIHTGSAQERDGDYFGPTLNRAARIMAAGHGGQILVSSITAAAIETALPDSTSLDDLGNHQLKDLDRTERIYQLRHPELPANTAPLRTASTRRHNLPEYLTSFVGRNHQMEELAEAVSGHRLVVLTGVGGTGKTRLAVEYGEQRVDEYPDGVWLVELAPINDPSLVFTAIGDVWGLRPGEGVAIDEVVIRFLRSKDTLLLMDNCEHLLEATATAIRKILAAGPHLRVIATSRESLGISGEHLIQVPSLTLPAAAGAESESAELFVERAASSRPGFALDSDEHQAVARICHRVGGIPLGLELAAARLRSLSVIELADRLEESFRILAGSAKAALPRQRTLEATIDWSHDLLTPGERAIFRRISVFAGGFDLEAAEAVCPGEEVDPWEVVDHIDSLVDKSLLIAGEGPDGSTRYRLLEPVRQYAQEKLRDSTEAPAMQLAHAHHFAARVAAAAPRLRASGQTVARQLIDVDFANVRSALTTLLEAGDIARYLELWFDLFAYWIQSGKHVDAISLATGGLQATSDEVDPVLRLRVWWSVAFLGAAITQPDAVGYGREGLALAESLGEPHLRGRMELALGAAIRHTSDDPEYEEHLEAGMRLLEESSGDPWWEPDWDRAILSFVLAAYLPPGHAKARSHFDTAADIYARLGDETQLAATLVESWSLSASEPREWIVGNLRRALDVLRRIDVPYWRGHAAMLLGNLAGIESDHDEATELLTLAADDLADCGDLFCWASSIRARAISDSLVGNLDRARRDLGEAIEALPRLPIPEVARSRTLDAATVVLAAAGEAQEAAVLYGLAEAAAGEGPAPGRPERMRTVLDLIEGRLADTELQRLVAEGASLSVDDGLERIRHWLAD